MTSTTNVILHAWLKEQLLAVLAQLPQLVLGLPHLDRLPWEHWREGLLHLATLPAH